MMPTFWSLQVLWWLISLTFVPSRWVRPTAYRWRDDLILRAGPISISLRLPYEGDAARLRGWRLIYLTHHRRGLRARRYPGRGRTMFYQLRLGRLELRAWPPGAWERLVPRPRKTIDLAPGGYTAAGRIVRARR